MADDGIYAAIVIPVVLLAGVFIYLIVATSLMNCSGRPQPQQRSRQHVAETQPLSQPHAAPVERAPQTQSDRSAMPGLRLISRRSGCNNFHLPWKKCPRCTINGPRDSSIELPAESSGPAEVHGDYLPAPPHELQAKVPNWQADPENRMTSYGNFYDPDHQELYRPMLPPKPAQTHQRDSAAPASSPERQRDGPSNYRSDQYERESPASPNSDRVGSGHVAFTSYAARAEMNDHQKIREVLPGFLPH